MTLVEKENGGQLSCFEVGIASSAAEIVFFLDADDAWEPGYVERVLRVYPGNPHAKLVLGRTLQARGDIAGALELTREAVDAYQAADEGFIYRREAEAMLDELLALGEA